MRAVQRDAVQGGTYMGNCCATTNCIRVRMRLEAASPCWLLRVPLRSAAQLGFTLNPKPAPCPNPYPGPQRSAACASAGPFSLAEGGFKHNRP